MRNRAESWTQWRRQFPNRNDLPMRTVAVKGKPGRLSQLANQAYITDDKEQEWFIVNTLVEVDKKKTDPASGGCPS